MKFEKDALIVYSRIIHYLEKWYDYSPHSFNKQVTMFNLENPIDINNVFTFCKSQEIEINGDQLFSEIVILNNILPTVDSKNKNLSLSQKWSKILIKIDAPNLLKIIEYIFAVLPTIGGTYFFGNEKLMD